MHVLRLLKPVNVYSGCFSFVNLMFYMLLCVLSGKNRSAKFGWVKGVEVIRVKPGLYIDGLVRWTGYRFVMRQSLRCWFRIPACAPKQGTLSYLLHLWIEM